MFGMHLSKDVLLNDTKVNDLVTLTLTFVLKMVFRTLLPGVCLFVSCEL